jgi:hypothetical protein
MIPDQTVLFAASGPEGFAYAADFLTAAEEASLLADIGTVSFSSFEMRGVVAKRRVALLGHSYSRAIEREIPQLLESLRARLAVWAGVQPDAFAMASCDRFVTKPCLPHVLAAVVDRVLRDRKRSTRTLSLRGGVECRQQNGAVLRGSLPRESRRGRN